MDSLPSLSAILKAEGPVSLASISFPFVEIITTIRSGPQLRALEKLLDLYSEKKAALAQVEEEMLSDWAIYWQSYESVNSGFREAEALSLEVDLIPKDNADSHVRREKVLALWYEHVRRAAKLASRWAAHLQELVATKKRLDLLRNDVHSLEMALIDAGAEGESGIKKKTILQERISDAVLDLVLEWKYSQKPVEVEKE
ncbi:hypothetical protein JCM5350_002848 [Sporobolomyces pararoseus]